MTPRCCGVPRSTRSRVASGEICGGRFPEVPSLMPDTNALEAFIDRYGPPAGEDGPVLMVREVFGIDPDPWQERVLRAFGRGERRITIRACHGPGKTAVASWCVINQSLTRFPQKTVATAPSASQLKGALVPEVKMWFRGMPQVLQDLFEVKAEGIYLKDAPESSYFEARTARAESPEALQGVHSEHVLLIADEASGVPEAIFEAAAGSMSGHNATTLLLSNPVRANGFFYDTHNANKAQWFTVHVSAEDSPRVTDDFVAYIAGQYGEESSAFRVRVLGEFPLADADTVIPFDYVESARSRDIVVMPNLREVWGLDVARFGDDTTALVKRNQAAVVGVLEWEAKDIMQTTGRVKSLWDETPDHERPEWVLVDVIGMGSGVVDRMRELKMPVRGINVAELPSSRDEYPRLRDELWFRAREWLASKDHVLPRCEGGCVRECPHERLAYELTVPRFDFTSSGKKAVEPKSETKKRARRSPNIADAFVLSFAADPAGLVHGTKDSSAWGTNWHEPVRRNRVVV